ARSLTRAFAGNREGGGTRARRYPNMAPISLLYRLTSLTWSCTRSRPHRPGGPSMLRTDLPVLTVLDGRDVTLRSFDMGRYTVHASLLESARIAVAPGTGTASGFSGYYHLEPLTHPLEAPVLGFSADERRPWPWLPDLDPFLIAAHSS